VHQPGRLGSCGLGSARPGELGSATEERCLCLDALLVLGLVVLEDTIRLFLRGVEVVWVVEQCLNADEQMLDRQRRLPSCAPG
jgi:hypothetical protein